MPKSWLEGVITFLHKKNATDKLDNYRPITLINIIYKIWATIMAARLNTILNLITTESQYAYKKKKSTIDILDLVNRMRENDVTQQLILFDLSKACGNIERDILWAKLYEAGIPYNCVRILKMGHEGNKLMPKCDGYVGKAEDTIKESFKEAH